MSTYIIDDNIAFSPGKYQIEYKDKIIPLSNVETEAFTLLCNGFGEAILRDKLIGLLWPGDGRDGGDANLNKCILNLRRKLSTIGYNEIIVTVPRVGYKIAASVHINNDVDLKDNINSQGGNKENHTLRHKLKVLWMIPLASAALFIALTFYYLTASTALSKTHINNITYYHPRFDTQMYLNDKRLKSIERIIKRNGNVILIKTEKSSSIMLSDKFGKKVTAAHTVYYTNNRNTEMCEVSNFLRDEKNEFYSISNTNRVISKISLDCDSKHWVSIESNGLISNQKKKHFYWTLLGRDEVGLPIFKVKLYGAWVSNRNNLLIRDDKLKIHIISKEIEIINPYTLSDNPLITFITNEITKNSDDIYIDVLEHENDILMYRVNILDSVPIIYKLNK